MSPIASDITIAVTVYNRSDYILGAVQSALDQTVSVRVNVVEDYGPDPELRDLVTKRFGNRIAYFRNPTNRGLADNWNACLDYCQTEWISILHDDGLLRPNLLQTMFDLCRKAPECTVFFGRSALMEGNRVQPPPPVEWPGGWRRLDVN